MRTAIAAIALALATFQLCAWLLPTSVRTGVGDLFLPAKFALREAVDDARDAALPPLRHMRDEFAERIEEIFGEEDVMRSLTAPGEDLTGAQFVARRLDHALLDGAVLDGANFTKSYLAGASLEGISAKGAIFEQAVLEGAVLTRADLSSALFTGADMRAARLDGARLEGADLAGAVGLTQSQLDRACGDKTTRLPPGLAVPPCKDAVAGLAP